MSQQQALLTGLIPLCLTLVGGCDLPRNAYGKTCSESSDCGEGLICVFNDPLQPEGQCDTPPGDPPTPEPGAAEPDVPLNDDCTCQDPEANCLPCEAGFICELQTRSCVPAPEECLQNERVCGLICGVCPAGNSCVGDDPGGSTDCVVTGSPPAPMIFPLNFDTLRSSNGEHELVGLDFTAVENRFGEEGLAIQVRASEGGNGYLTNTSGLPLNLRGQPFTISVFFRLIPGAVVPRLLIGRLDVGASLRGCNGTQPGTLTAFVKDTEAQTVCKEFDTPLGDAWHQFTLASSGSETWAILDGLPPFVLLEQEEQLTPVDLGDGLPLLLQSEGELQLDELEIRFEEPAQEKRSPP